MNKDDLKNKIVAAPEYKGYLAANCNYRKLSAIVGLQYINGLYTGVSAKESKENFLLLNASVGYQLTQHVKLWVRGENLLAQSYEINLGYPMPRATFMAGTNLNF